MLSRFIRRLRSRSLSLSTKILGLLLISVVFSLSLAGWLIYGGLRDRTWDDASDALVQTAATAAVGAHVDGLNALHGPKDRKQPAYRRVKAELHEIFHGNHFENEDRKSRIAVVRFDRKKSTLTMIASTDDDRAIGETLTVEDAVYKCVARHEATAQEGGGQDAHWLVAYAPLQQADAQLLYLLKVERSTAPLRRELFGHLWTIVLAALAGLALAALSGWFVTKQITKPLRAFVDVMRLMQNTGDYDIKIDLHPEDRDMSVVEYTFQALVRRMQDSREREEQSHWSTLQALVTALDVRDNETAGHSMRVTRYGLAIGERMRLKQEVLDQLRQGALLHDIGKIGVPDAVLRKAGKLDAEEWKEMRKHPAIGRTFLEGIIFLRPAMAVVYCHHERWDGTGYPQGLEGDAIPMAARVFAVADALDAITSQRYYKAARSFREAQAEIEACAGSHFDPNVVRAFLTIPEKVFTRIRTETNLAGVEFERLRKSVM
jgi:HD-GYP domain-containing protein (c-di-GMP phosphodiesterase class II)